MFYDNIATAVELGVAMLAEGSLDLFRYLQVLDAIAELLIHHAFSRALLS